MRRGGWYAHDAPRVRVRARLGVGVGVRVGVRVGEAVRAW